ncbi:MAG: hypothetical protein EHM71_04235, partial [Zetaproteobacteria bacterium]
MAQRKWSVGSLTRCGSDRRTGTMRRVSNIETRRTSRSPYRRGRHFFGGGTAPEKRRETLSTGRQKGEGRMKRTRWGALLAGLLVAVLASGTVVAADKVQPTAQKPLKLRLGFEDPVEITKPEAAYAMVFKSIVEARTNGAVLVDIFGHSVLGGSKAMLEMVKSGSLDICIQTGAMGAYYPAFQVISLPYLFKSEDIAWWVFDKSAYWKDLMADLNKKTGLRLLGMGQNGVRHFSNNVRPIRTPADMKGIKFRVMQSPIFVKFVEALGAKAVPIAWAELYTALQTKVVDGQENP